MNWINYFKKAEEINQEFEINKLSKLFAMVTEFSGSWVGLETLSGFCSMALSISSNDQRDVLKNKLTDKAHQLIKGHRVRTFSETK